VFPVILGAFWVFGVSLQCFRYFDVFRDFRGVWGWYNILFGVFSGVIGFTLAYNRFWGNFGLFGGFAGIFGYLCTLVVLCYFRNFGLIGLL